MKAGISRRMLLSAGPLALTACRKAEGAYFGKTDPPDRQRLVAVLGVEPGSLDPATSLNLLEDCVIHALCEGLTTLHPVTAEAMAGLATHYDLTPDGLRYNLYLRGHSKPWGIRLANRDNLPLEYSQGLPAGPDSLPARWSDGVRITAHDLVYSWRRTIDPVTACTYAYLMYCIVNAEEINSGKLPPEKLAVRAIDDSTVQVDLRAPTPFFLELVASKYFCPVPHHVIETEGKAWTEPGRMVSSGAFILRERRSGEKIVLARNPHYYEAGAVSLEEAVFLPVVDAAASANLYRTGRVAITPTTPTLIPLLHRKKDYWPKRVFVATYALLKATHPPFNDVRVRYAFNMATDKQAIAEMIPGQMPSVNLVPPIKIYDPPNRLFVPFGGSAVDVLAFDPRAARQLLENAIGRSRLRTEFLYPPFPDFRLVAEILQQQWRQALGVELVLVMQDVATFVQAVNGKNYRGIAECGDGAVYVDPSFFLDMFTSRSAASGSDWSDTTYDSMIADAGATAHRQRRLEKLAECERHLLRAMPLIPLSASVWPWLAKPFVKGLGRNMLDRQQFKYAWIDTKWRPER
jgi:ABC-type oligopeptide transport system substrate-binding subunit